MIMIVVEVVAAAVVVAEVLRVEAEEAHLAAEAVVPEETVLLHQTAEALQGVVEAAAQEEEDLELCLVRK